MMRNTVAIDPGASGAFAITDADGHTLTVYMPEDPRGIMEIIRKFRESTFFIEDVGSYMPGNSGPAAVSFARHCGQLDGLLLAFEVAVVYVRPQVWMKTMPLTHFDPLSKAIPLAERNKELARRKIVRKNEIKAFVAEKFPLVKVTLKNSDALGLLYWASHCGKEQLK